MEQTHLVEAVKHIDTLTALLTQFNILDILQRFPERAGDEDQVVVPEGYELTQETIIAASDPIRTIIEHGTAVGILSVSIPLYLGVKIDARYLPITYTHYTIFDRREFDVLSRAKKLWSALKSFAKATVTVDETVSSQEYILQCVQDIRVAQATILQVLRTLRKEVECILGYTIEAHSQPPEPFAPSMVLMLVQLQTYINCRRNLQIYIWRGRGCPKEVK